MSLKPKKMLITGVLALSLFFTAGCVAEMESWNRPSVAVEPPPMMPSVQHKGPPLFCRAGQGIVQVAHNWYDLSEAAFMLYQDERVNVSLPLEKKGAAPAPTIQAFFDHDGQKMVFCPVVDAPPGQRIACASIYVLDDDLHAGIKRTLDIPSSLKGGAISCAYQQVNLKKLTNYPAGGN